MSIKKPRTVNRFGSQVRLSPLIQGQGSNKLEDVFFELPPEYKWLCINCEGEAWAYIYEPIEDFRFGRFASTNEENGLYVGVDFDITDWENSLIYRHDVNETTKAEGDAKGAIMSKVPVYTQKAKAAYRKRTTSLTITVNPEKEKDVYDWLNNQENKAGGVKRLIRAELSRQRRAIALKELEGSPYLAKSE